ncbi:MAG: hypothetical protein R2794_06030 [Chitinophagales bacterium]
MKSHFLTVTTLTVLFSIQLIAQTTIQDIRTEIDSAFIHLDLQYIPSGILLEKAIATPRNILSFEQENDSITDFYTWRSLYKAMQFGSFNVQGFISEDSINKILQSNREVDVIPLFVLDYTYNSMKNYALDSNLLSVSNNAFYDVSGRNEVPYTTLTLFNACAPFGVSYSSNAKFVFNDNYYFTNDTLLVDSIHCDFSDGMGMRNINWGDTITINYGDLNTHMISISMYKNGNERTSTFAFKMADICPEDYPHDIIGSITGEVAYPFGSTDEEAKISAKYTITYGYESDGETKHTSLKKPIIFIPGLDPGYMNYKTTFDDCKYGIMGWIDIVSEQQYNLEKGEINDWTPEFDYSLT